MYDVGKEEGGGSIEEKAISRRFRGAGEGAFENLDILSLVFFFCMEDIKNKMQIKT